MSILKAEIFNPEKDTYTSIYLPAGFEEIEDALQTVGGTAEGCAANIIDFSQIDMAENKTIQSCTVYELNYLAELIQEMNDYHKMQFTSLVEACCKSEYPEIKEVINIALNAPKIDCLLALASNDHDLGEFYVDNDLLPQLAEMESLTDEQYKWMCAHFDLEKIGREVREQEQGSFVSGGYIILNDAMKQIYDGNPVLPKPCDYIFRLEIAVLPTGDEPNDDHTVTLKLPATQDELQSALDTLGVSRIEYCCAYGFNSSIVPQLADCYGDMEDFDMLNGLAKQIEALESDSLIKYKAMLETVKCLDMQTATAVYEHIEDFTLDRSCLTPTEYAEKVLETIDFPLKEQLLPHFPTYEYGNALLKQNGIDNTSYGMLVPNDGVTLQQKMEQAKLAEQEMENAHHSNIEIGGMSL